LPVNEVGDRQPAKLSEGNVVTPPGYKEAYLAFIESGWSSVPFDPAYGGQGLPWLVSSTLSEMWSSTNMAFALCPLLTQGSIELLSSHGNDAQKQAYLPKLISGQWTGSMCLTEPQAGSDVGALTTKAVKQGDHYRISGQKIYITYGDHDLTDNIIHMVLGRCADAPEGSKGISLFIVPKVLENGDKNDVKVLSLEHKMGIHGSPTAVMAFGDGGDGAIGYLVGEENKGLRYMFTMMNNARLAVAIEGLACIESAFQQASAYANERVQGFDLETKAPTAIGNHPDVARMLAQMQGHLVACRSLCYRAAAALDLAAHHGDDACKKSEQMLVNFLIPVVKAHATDMGFQLSSSAMQVFGGIGYIEETGIAQFMRDSRIAMIYEGTNGIQAMDLVMRKLLIHDGACYQSYRDLITHWLTQGEHRGALTALLVEIDAATAHIQSHAASQPKKVAAIAYDYLQLIALYSSCVVHHNILTSGEETLCPADISQEFITRTLPIVQAKLQVIKAMLG
jgi:alkylation response protein AidB-like acyl-CoA dehydrogenase